MPTEIPVYLFLGFLESGKTKFIQETMEDVRFDSGERTLLLVLEEGEEEYDSSRFAVKNFHIEQMEAKDLSLARLTAAAKACRAERVVVEYNGMLELGAFFDAMPDGWMIAQVMTFFDAATFLSYNRNMRQLVFDKVQYADMVVFNRFREGDDRMQFHKVIRGISRRSEIVYEYTDGRAEYDDIVDPLPYDLNAEVICISDRDYAIFYRDLMEDMQKYDKKTITFTGMAATDRKLKQGTIVVGRHIMTCCEADITYSGIVVLHHSLLPIHTRDWVEVTGRIDIEYHKLYGQNGPVLKATSIKPALPPKEELATFY